MGYVLNVSCRNEGSEKGATTLEIQDICRNYSLGTPLMKEVYIRVSPQNRLIPTGFPRRLENLENENGDGKVMEHEKLAKSHGIF